MPACATRRSLFVQTFYFQTSGKGSSSDHEGSVYTNDDYIDMMSRAGDHPGQDGVKGTRAMYQARSTFAAADAGETDLVDDEIVPVLERTGTGWWLVHSLAGVGWVPSHFLRSAPAGATVPDIQEKSPEADEIYAVDGSYGADLFAPKMPQHEREKSKESGHVANRFLNREGSREQDDSDEAKSTSVSDMSSLTPSGRSTGSERHPSGSPLYEIIPTEIEPYPCDGIQGNHVFQENSIYDPHGFRAPAHVPGSLYGSQQLSTKKVGPQVAPKPRSGSIRSQSSSSSDDYMQATMPGISEPEWATGGFAPQASVRDLRAKFNKT